MRYEGCMMEVDTQSHVLLYIEYGGLRKDKLMIYIRQVIKRRMKEQAVVRGASSAKLA